MTMDLHIIQETKNQLIHEKWDGWLLYDFRRSNELACTFLQIPSDTMLTRRLAYWIPAQGDPIKVLHRVESHVLDHLPGKVISYGTWQEWEIALEKLLKGSEKVAMEYSPRNANPYVSKVDAGTVELVRSFNVEVKSSADLLQRHTSVWDAKQHQSHLEAAQVASDAVEMAWKWISDHIRNEKPITEYQVQQYILEYLSAHSCKTEGDPIVAVNAHSADPHYCPSPDKSSEIKCNDFILIDLWCKKKTKHAVYADICRVGVVDKAPTAKQQEIFSIVRRAQRDATELVKRRFAKNEPLRGWEVDEEARKVIREAGYEMFFTHRTGHNIGVRDHGDGAHLDNFETQDQRLLLPGTCFSIEPGIYLPEEFGIRLEYDVYVNFDGSIEINGGIQDEIKVLL